MYKFHFLNSRSQTQIPSVNPDGRLAPNFADWQLFMFLYSQFFTIAALNNQLV